MFKTYNVADSLWQMNLFVAMQAYRNMSTLNYMAVPADESEEDELAEESDRRLSRKKETAA